jgi:hypothetical protein
MLIGTRVTIAYCSGIHSGKLGAIVRHTEIKTNGRGIPELSGHYKPIDWRKEYAVRLDNGELITMFKNRVLIKE